MKDEFQVFSVTTEMVKDEHGNWVERTVTDGPYSHLPKFPVPPDEGDDEWRTRARARHWYHTTPARNMEVIAREGLQPRSAEGCVHLSVLPMPELVETLFRTQSVVVYEVSLEGLPDEAITPGYDDMEYCLAVTCVIPPGNLRLVG